MRRLILIVAVCALSACSGIEVGGKLGIYAVDEHQEATRAYKRPPLKCWFVSCPSEQVEGS